MLLYGVSHSHAIRSRRLVGVLLADNDKLHLKYNKDSGHEKYSFYPVHINDLIDGFVAPSINKLSPLFQLAIDDKNQFLHEAHNQNISKKGCLLWGDTLMKVFLSIIIYFFPAVVLFGALLRFIQSVVDFDFLVTFYIALLISFCLIAFFTFFLIFKNEISYIFTVHGRIKKSLDLRRFVKDISLFMMREDLDDISEIKNINRFFSEKVGGHEKYKETYINYARSIFCDCEMSDVECDRQRREIINVCLGNLDAVKNFCGKSDQKYLNVGSLDLRYILFEYAKKV